MRGLDVAKQLDMARTVHALLSADGERREEARLRSLAWSSFGWHLAFEAYRETKLRALPTRFPMTTVAFITYYYNDVPRRVGPLEQEPAESFARELARRDGTRDVILEEWGLLNARKMEKPA